MKTRKHKYAPAEAHLMSLMVIAITAINILLCVSIGVSDITAIIALPCITCGIILRCAWDWIFVISTVVFATAEYIVKRIGGVIHG